MFIVLNWTCYDDVAIVTNKDGQVVTFADYNSAVNYAARELNWYWKVVNLDS